MNVPSDLRYTSHDEWIRVDGDTITLGITDFAQDALGELVHVELPEAGDTFKVGDPICEVESVKAVAEVYSPVACAVIEVNEQVEDDAEIINSDPYASWLVKATITDRAGLETLLDATAYQAKISGG
jgi:glycine cleavage system H protein